MAVSADHVPERRMFARERAREESVSARRVEAEQSLGYDPRTRYVTSATEDLLHSVRGRGTPMGPSLRAGFETVFGADLSRVRLHTDGVADRLSRSLTADAFTVGDDIFVRRDRFRPGTIAGDRLLAHELTHVLQPGVADAGRLRVSSPDDAAEREAERVAVGAAERAADTVHRSPEKESLGVETDRMTREYVEGFDVALGKWLADHPLAQQGGKYLLVGIHKVLAEEFRKRGGVEADFLIEALGEPNELRKMPGAPVVRRINDLATIANSTAKGSLRTKMSLVYMAIRCGVLTRGMYRAQAQSQAGAGSQKTRDAAVQAQWGLDAKRLRESGVSGKSSEQRRKYFSRQQRVEQQQRSGRGGEGSGLAAQEARTIGQSEFVGITLSYDELKTIANGDQKARTAAAATGKNFDNLSEDEKRSLMIREYPDVPLPDYTPGFAVYRIDPGSGESIEAQKRQTGMIGGLSGSTDMYLHLASYLGAGKNEMRLVRLAALGEMLPRRDHSFYEVVVAARGYGLTDIDPAKGVAAYAKIPPLTTAEIQQGTEMALPSAYRKKVTGKASQQVLKADLNEVQASVERYAQEFEAAGKPPPNQLAQRWHDYFQSFVYRWAHDSKVGAALTRINAVLGAGSGVQAGLLTSPEAKRAALGVLQVVQRHSGNPTRVVPEAHASKAFKSLDDRIGTIPANQVLAVYVKQYVGPAGLIIPSVQFAVELGEIESGARQLPPINEVGDKSATYANTIWPEAKQELHKRAQAAEQAYADALAKLDTGAPAYVQDKKAIEERYRRAVATGAMETWKRVQAQIEAAEALTPTERYAIYTYTQGSFYTELNAALAHEQKLTSKQHAVAVAATVGLRKLPVYPGPVYRAQRSGGRLRQQGVSRETLAAARERWPVGKTIEHADFLSTFKEEEGPKRFMGTDQGKEYDLVVKIEKVKTGRWTLLLSATEAIAAGENPEHEGEVTFPPGSRFQVTKPLDVTAARTASTADKAFVNTTWDEVTPAQAAPAGAPLPAVGDDKVPDQYKPAPAQDQAHGAPRPPAAIPPPPPMRGQARKDAVADAKADVKGEVATLVAAPNPTDLVKGVDDAKLPEPSQDVVEAVLGIGADLKQ